MLNLKINKPKSETKTFSITMPVDKYNDIKKNSEKNDVSISVVVNTLVDLGIESLNKPVVKTANEKDIK